MARNYLPYKPRSQTCIVMSFKNEKMISNEKLILLTLKLGSKTLLSQSEV